MNFSSGEKMPIASSGRPQWLVEAPALGGRMNFRTKIWMLPISAAAVFVVGVGVSFAVGERTSGVLKHLH